MIRYKSSTGSESGTVSGLIIRLWEEVKNVVKAVKKSSNLNVKDLRRLVAPLGSFVMLQTRV